MKEENKNIRQPVKTGDDKGAIDDKAIRDSPLVKMLFLCLFSGVVYLSAPV